MSKAEAARWGQFLFQGLPPVARVQPPQGKGELVQGAHGEDAGAGGGIEVFDLSNGADDGGALGVGEEGSSVGDAVVQQVERRVAQDAASVPGRPFAPTPPPGLRPPCSPLRRGGCRQCNRPRIAAAVILAEEESVGYEVAGLPFQPSAGERYLHSARM